MPGKILKVLEGPTAVGKTALAIEWALAADTEIVSADSRQFYQELNIGVARPSEQELATVPHHFIANKSIFNYYSVSHYEQEAMALLDTLFKTHDTVILAGGSGLYVNAICKGIDDLPDPAPELRQKLKEQETQEGLASLQDLLKKLDPVFYETVDLQNPVRLRRALEVCITTGKPYSTLRTSSVKQRPFTIERYVLNRPKEELHERINLRVDIMMESGLLDEARQLYPHRALNALQTVGYRELFAYLDGQISLDQAITDIKTNTRRYAKRQLTWLRKQADAVWMEV